MSSDVWAVWPTVSPERSEKMTEVWHKQGYKVAVLVNPPHEETLFSSADTVIFQREWRGFPAAANTLCHTVPGNVVVVVGDDVYPDPDRTAQEIEDIFLDQFPDTLGVMQPIGDKFAWTHKCAVSPWIGRAFIQEAYDGKGPFWEEYFHYFSDQELQEVATRMRCFYQREDIIQFHDHWQRKAGHKRPQHLMPALEKHKTDKKIYKYREKHAFPSVVR